MKTLLFATLAVALLSVGSVHATIGFITSISPPGPIANTEVLYGVPFGVSLQVYKYGVTDSPGQGATIQCFLRTYTVDSFGTTRSNQQDLPIPYQGDSGTGSPLPNDKYAIQFNGQANQRYEYTIYCKDLMDGTTATPASSEFNTGQVVFYGPVAGVQQWMSESFANFTGNGFAPGNNLSAGQLNSDYWRVGGLAAMDFGTTRIGGVFARGQNLQSIQAGVYGVTIQPGQNALVIQPAHEDSQSSASTNIFDPGFLEIRLQNNLFTNIYANNTIKVDFGFFATGNSGRMAWNMSYRIASQKFSTENADLYTALEQPWQTTLNPGETTMRAFSVNINKDIPYGSYLFIRFNMQSTGLVSGPPDASGLYMLKAQVDFGNGQSNSQSISSTTSSMQTGIPNSTGITAIPNSSSAISSTSTSISQHTSSSSAKPTSTSTTTQSTVTPPDNGGNDLGNPGAATWPSVLVVAVTLYHALMLILR